MVVLVINRMVDKEFNSKQPFIKVEQKGFNLNELTDEEIKSLNKRVDKLFCGMSEDYIIKRQATHIIRNEKLRRFLESPYRHLDKLSGGVK